jgi:hypothetical protein
MSTNERLRIVPVVHGRLEPAKRVRRALVEWKPDAVAIEIPETLAIPFSRAVKRLPLLSILRWRHGDQGNGFLLVEPTDGAVEAARWAFENGAELVCADRDSDEYGAHRDAVPDPWALEKLPEEKYDELCRAVLGPPDEEDGRREETMAFHVRRLLDAGKRVALVCGAAHVDGVRAKIETATVRPLSRTKRDVELFHLAEESSREVLTEPPYLQAAYERCRSGAVRGDPVAPDVPDGEDAEIVDFAARKKSGKKSTIPAPKKSPATELEPEPERYQLAVRLSRAAKQRLLDEDGERISTGALAILVRVARNWSMLAGGLAPDLVQLVTCARGVGGDDFAYRFWELATTWPWQTDRPGIPVLRPTVEDLYENAAHLRFHLKTKARRHMLRVVTPRPREKKPGEWKEKWQGGSVVSHPPEDLVIEGYGAFIRKRATGILSSEMSRTEPFTTSLRDGIDLRETIRNLAHDGRIFVRENRPVKGTVGAVVIVWDDDRSDRYPWLMTWQGEHDQESDMCLYSTAPGEKLIGPGISRCEYGGLVMTLPPGRMFHVWEDPYFDAARSKPERLLLAGIDYSLERLIVYVGPNPPRSALSAHAARQGKKVVYVPIGQLSPILLKKVRVFHVLDGRRVRAYASEYIRD